MKFYPRAHENRLPSNHPSLRGPRKALLKAAAKNFIYLQLLFFALFAYLFGSLYQQGSHVHNLNVLYVDYDQGTIGASIRNAYQNLQGDNFPSLDERSPSDFATPDDLRQQVCETRYWAALYISRGASDRLQTALTGDSAAYNKADVMSYIWNEARYSAVVDSLISDNLQTLSSAARTIYAAGNWTSSIENATTSTFTVFANPWELTSINIQPTTQGSRLIYNTLVIILVLIQEFFYLGTINSLYEAFKINARFKPHYIILFRNSLTLAYTFCGSLCTAGAIWAFRAGWNVNGNQFVLTWLILWLFAHANFLTLDVFSIWLPPPFVPMALIAWIVLNVTSILLPFELSPGFYSWAYAMPAHEVFQILIDIWSRGCNPQLRYALPILFAFELSGLLISGLGVYRRAHYAVVKEEAELQAFQKRLDAAIATVQEKDKERSLARAATAVSRTSSEINAVNDKTDEDIEAGMDEDRRKEIAGVLRHEDSEMQKVQRQSSRATNFGPSFGFAFGAEP